MFKKSVLLGSTASLLLFGSPAHAETMTMEQMQQQLMQLSKQVETLTETVKDQGAVIESQKAQLAQTAKTAAPAPITATASSSNADAVKITMNPSPKFTSADGQYSFQPTGRVHLDVTHFADDKRDHPDNAHFRRARLGFKGDLGEDVNYKAEIDFGGEAVNMKEVYLTYTGMDFADLQVGNFKPPVGLDQNTSTNYMPFIELAPVSTAFTRDEIIGAALKGGGENWSWAGGVFNEDAGNNNAADDEAWSVDARTSVDLLQSSPDILHVGVGGSIRTPNAATENVTLAAKPAGTGNNMVTTGAIANVDRSTMIGGEMAAVFGPVSVQGEYMHYAVERDSGSDPAFDGWYAQASYFLTGETRPYKGKTGNFERVKPITPFSLKNGGIGAWEILARVDNLDLNDSENGVTGGELNDITLGVNWYPRDNVRLMLDYVDADTDSEGVVANDNPQIITLRTQWDF